MYVAAVLSSHVALRSHVRKAPAASHSPVLNTCCRDRKTGMRKTTGTDLVVFSFRTTRSAVIKILLSRSARKLKHRSKSIPRLATFPSGSFCARDMLLVFAKCFTRSQDLIACGLCHSLFRTKTTRSVPVVSKKIFIKSCNHGIINVAV